MKNKIVLIVFILIPFISKTQEITDPVSTYSKIRNIYLSAGLNTVHYSTWSGTYDSTDYTIDNSFPGLNFGGGILQNLYFSYGSQQEFILSFGADLSSRSFRINYNNELINVNELFFQPVVGIGIRSDIAHSLWLVKSHKAIECRLNLGLPVLVAQNAIIDRSKVKAKSTLFVKYHFGFDVRFTSMQENGRGHQVGIEAFLENSFDPASVIIPFKTPYYVGCRIYYCIKNVPKD